MASVLKSSKFPSSEDKSSSADRTGVVKNNTVIDAFEDGCCDILIPPVMAAGTENSCSILLQIDPEDASVLDFEGQSGAIGRFETHEDVVTFDLKGFQYDGVIRPGPTAMVIALNKAGGVAKVESITDEFVTLRKTHDVMAKLNAVVEGDMDETYKITDEDVNRKLKPKAGEQQQLNIDVAGDADDGKSKSSKRTKEENNKSPVKRKKTKKTSSN